MLSENEREARWSEEYCEAFAMTNGAYISKVTDNWQIDDIKYAMNMFLDELPSNVPAFLYNLVIDKMDGKEYFTELYNARKASLAVDTYAKDIDKQDIINSDGIIKLIELFTNMIQSLRPQ